MEAWEDEWREWRAERERDLRDPHGWLSLTRLHWLGPEPTALSGLPGRWRSGPSGVVVEAAAAEGLALSGRPIDGDVRVDLVDLAPGPRIVAGDLEIEPIRRGERFAVRVRDPRSRMLAEFAGVPTFPPDPAWVLSGQFEPYDGPRPVTVDSAVDGLTYTLTARGVVRSIRDGIPFSLTVVGFGDDYRVPFRDATTGVTTDAAGRSLAVAPPDAAGRAELDFNWAVNLPCAFSPYATCPLPPRENVIPFAVEAGERTPHG